MFVDPGMGFRDGGFINMWYDDTSVNGQLKQPLRLPRPPHAFSFFRGRAAPCAPGARANSRAARRVSTRDGVSHRGPSAKKSAVTLFTTSNASVGLGIPCPRDWLQRKASQRIMHVMWYPWPAGTRRNNGSAASGAKCTTWCRGDTTFPC